MVVHAGTVAGLLRRSLGGLLQRLDSDRRGDCGPAWHGDQPGKEPDARGGGAAGPDLRNPAGPCRDQRAAADPDGGLGRDQGPDHLHDDRTVRALFRRDRHERHPDRPVRRMRFEPFGQRLHPGSDLDVRQAEHRLGEIQRVPRTDYVLRTMDAARAERFLDREGGDYPQAVELGRRWHASGRLAEAARRRVPIAAVVDEIAAELDRMQRAFFTGKGERGMDELRIVKATDGDVERLARMNQELIEDEQHENPMNVEQLAERMRGFLNTTYSAWLFTAGGDVKGYALVDHARQPLYLRHFFICRHCRREGWGRKAFHLLLRELGTDVIDIDVLVRNTRGRRFWEALGFGERSIRMRYEAGRS